MQPFKGSQYISSYVPPYLVTTLANSGDILLSSATTHRNNSQFLRQHQNSSVFSLVDPNIELPTISAKEVEQVLSQLQSSQSSIPPPSRKTSGFWFSKDDSFTPPPTKRSFGGCVTPSVTYASCQTQNSQTLQTRSSSLVAALQLPPLGVGTTVTSSHTSPPLHAALRRQLLAPSTTFTNLQNAAKQRQENLTVRLANRAKLSAAARIPVVTNSLTVVSECTTSTRSIVSQPASLASPSTNDLHIPQDPTERFRFVCPHPRCGRRYQARIGLMRHLVKYHGEVVDAEEVAAVKPKTDPPQVVATAAVCIEEASLSRPSVIFSTITAGPSSVKPFFSVDQRSSQSLDRSKMLRRCPSSPPPSSSTSTLACPPLHHSATAATAIASVRSGLRSRTSPSLLFDRQATSTGGGSVKVAIVSMQHSPLPDPTTEPPLIQQPTPPPPSQPKAPFHMSIYSNNVSELHSNSGGALTEPWGCSSVDQTAPVVSVPYCSSSCCWPDDREEFDHEEEEEDFLDEDCSSDLGFGSCYYPSRPTDSLPCLLYPTYPRHFHSPSSSFHLLPRGSAVDLSTTGMTEEYSSCCWTADSEFSSSLGGCRINRHSSEDGRVPGTGGFWTSPYPRIPPTRQRKQRISANISRRGFSTTGDKKMHCRQDGCHGRRRTMSSGGGSVSGLFTTFNAADSSSTARLSSVNCSGDAGGGNNPMYLTKGSDELVACPVHDCGLVCSGCENLCEHLKECHLPDSQNKPVRLIFACPVKSCHTFCSNEAAFEAHFDAHLESRISGKIGDFFRGPSTDCESVAKPRQLQRRRHVKSVSSLADFEMDAFDGLCLPVSPADERTSLRISDNPDCSDHVSPAKSDSPSTPASLPDGENRSLLQALDLLPDDVLHELLQEKTGTAINGAFTGPLFFNIGGSGNTPTLSNGSLGVIAVDEGSARQQCQQTPMVVSGSSASDIEASVSVRSDRHHQGRCGGGIVKRQRNSLTCLNFPSEGQTALSRARSAHLRTKGETLPPSTLPSASQLLFHKSVASHSVSTEDLLYLSEASQRACQMPGSTCTNCQKEKEGNESSFTFSKRSERPLACHLSDTDMPPLPSHVLPIRTTAAASPPSLRHANRLKRRRRTFGERFYTFDLRFSPPEQNITCNHFEGP